VSDFKCKLTLLLDIFFQKVTHNRLALFGLAYVGDQTFSIIYCTKAYQRLKLTDQHFK